MDSSAVVTTAFANFMPGVESIASLVIAVVAGLVVVGIVLNLVGKLGGGRISRLDDPNERKPSGESFTFGGKD